MIREFAGAINGIPNDSQAKICGRPRPVNRVHSGLIWKLGSSNTGLATRDSVAKTPIFQKQLPVWHGYRASPGDRGAILVRKAWERRRPRTIFGRVASEFPGSRLGLIMGDSWEDSLFKPVEQVVARAFCNLQAQFRSWFQLFLVYSGADRCEDAKPIRELCKP